MKLTLIASNPSSTLIFSKKRTLLLPLVECIVSVITPKLYKIRSVIYFWISSILFRILFVWHMSPPMSFLSDFYFLSNTNFCLKSSKSNYTLLKFSIIITWEVIPIRVGYWQLPYQGNFINTYYFAPGGQAYNMGKELSLLFTQKISPRYQ